MTESGEKEFLGFLPACLLADRPACRQTGWKGIKAGMGAISYPLSKKGTRPKGC